MIVLAVIAGVAKLTGLVSVVIVLGLAAGIMLVVSFWFFAAYLAEIALSVFAGRWLLGLASPSLGENRFLTLGAGLVLLALISRVPYLGPIVGWLAILLGLGASLLRICGKRPAAPVPFQKPGIPHQDL